MNESEGELGFGVRLYVNTGVAGAFEELLSQLRDTEPPELKAETFDRTHHKSPGKHRERGAGLLDTGEMNFVGLFKSGDEGAADVRGVIGKHQRWRMVYPAPEGGTADDAEYIEFPGILTSFKPVTPLDDGMTYNATVTPAGAPTHGTVGDLTP